MSDYPDGEFLLPLFPLPNLVFFPETRLPLHVFEPRYRALLADVLASDQRLGIVLLKPGWEEQYFGTPPVHRFATLGVVEQSVELDDGRYNILVRGDVRVRILGEVTSAPYRVAQVVVDRERNDDAQSAYAQRAWLKDLAQQYIEWLPQQIDVPELDVAGLEPLTNALIMSLNLDMEDKQQLLEMERLVERAEAIGGDLQQRIENMQFLAPYRRGSTDPNHN
jgi:Lon protease-like protein